jgi:hypothetical protein
MLALFSEAFDVVYVVCDVVYVVCDVVECGLFRIGEASCTGNRTMNASSLSD